MEMTSTRTVIVDGKARDYPLGTPYQAIAADAQDRYPSDILLVDRDGKLCELNKPLDRDCTLRMITAVDRPGRQTYERSVVFLMLAAFYDTVGTVRIIRINRYTFLKFLIQIMSSSCILFIIPLLKILLYRAKIRYSDTCNTNKNGRNS